MNLGFAFFFNSILLGIGLAMDAFSVSLANGLNEPRMNTKKSVAFAFNFHPEKSFTNYFVPVEEEGVYSVTLSTDDKEFGGFERVDKAYTYKAERTLDGRLGFFCYLPNRCALVFKKK